MLRADRSDLLPSGIRSRHSGPRRSPALAGLAGTRPRGAHTERTIRCGDSRSPATPAAARVQQPATLPPRRRACREIRAVSWAVLGPEDANYHVKLTVEWQRWAKSAEPVGAPQPCQLWSGYGETSSNTRPLVSIAKAAVTIPAKAATAANMRNTDCSPPAIM